MAKSKKAQTDKAVLTTHIIVLVISVLIAWTGFGIVQAAVNDPVGNPGWSTGAFMVLFGGAVGGVAINKLSMITREKNGKK